MNVCNIDDKTHHGINLLRGVFAILVVAAHGLDLAVKTFRPGFEESDIGRVIFMTLGNGFYWVMGFFVISGFCIQLSVQGSYAKKQYSAMSYIIARITRIAPLFYMGLFVALFTEFLLYGSAIRPPV